MKKIKIGYKIFTIYTKKNPYGFYKRVEEGDYLSFNQSQFCGGFIYSKKTRNYRKKGNGPLALFETEIEAQLFVNHFSMNIPDYVIEKVKYKESKDKILFYIYNSMRKEILRVPSGTVFADWVEIIEE